MYSRRKFIRSITAASGSALFMLKNGSVNAAEKLIGSLPVSTVPRVIASDEGFWNKIRNDFNIDYDLINLNSGGVSPAPRVVINTFKEQIDYSNLAPSFNIWEKLEPGIEKVREKLSEILGCGKEEIAITRNTSESIQTIQFGMDMKKGDAVLTTSLDYPRMINAFDKLKKRYGVDVIQVKYPVPLLNKEDYVNAIKNSITENTKLILISHICYATGQILPVTEISKLAHDHNIKLICDGAHSFNHIPFNFSELQCDYFASSLHKWTYAPVGTGFLYIKRDLIKDVWPLMSAPAKLHNDIRKFEDIGTHPAANHNAIREALDFNTVIGVERKAERLRYLNKLWINKVRYLQNVKFNINIDDESNYAGIVNFSINKVDMEKVEKYLFEKHKILITYIDTDDVKGLRVTPNIFTTPEEIGKFAEAIETIIVKKGNEL